MNDSVPARLMLHYDEPIGGGTIIHCNSIDSAKEHLKKLKPAHRVSVAFSCLARHGEPRDNLLKFLDQYAGRVG